MRELTFVVKLQCSLFQTAEPVWQRGIILGRRDAYISVAMNPVSSDRNRKSMKTQQRMETVGTEEESEWIEAGVPSSHMISHTRYDISAFQGMSRTLSRAPDINETTATMSLASWSLSLRRVLNTNYTLNTSTAGSHYNISALREMISCYTSPSNSSFQVPYRPALAIWQPKEMASTESISLTGRRVN